MSDTTAKLLRGGPIASSIRAELTARVSALQDRGVSPTLAVVVASDDGAVRAYAEAKQKSAAKLGIALRLESLPTGAGQADLEALLDDLSADPFVHGILLELPIAEGLNAESAIAKHRPAQGCRRHDRCQSGA